MKLLRNPEIIRTALLQLLLSALVLIGCALWAPEMLLWAALTCAAFLCIWILSTAQRYRRIAQLASDVDRILHGDKAVTLHSYAEGELALLGSELAKMTIRLQQQEQLLLQDKRRLADAMADVSHQIRTPLTSIHLLVTMLQTAQPHRQQVLYRELQSLLQRIDWLITALLKLSRLDAGTVEFQKTTVSLQELVQEAARPLQIPMELRQQTLHLSGSGTVTGDRVWLVEALGNVLKNCMEHTPEGGSITVTTQENPLYSELTVADTGPGFLQEDLAHIFERFYKGSNATENSFGIGLNLCRMIVSAHNGTVKAENGPHGGAVFNIRFYRGTV